MPMLTAQVTLPMKLMVPLSSSSSTKFHRGMPRIISIVVGVGNFEASVTTDTASRCYPVTDSMSQRTT